MEQYFPVCVLLKIFIAMLKNIKYGLISLEQTQFKNWTNLFEVSKVMKNHQKEGIVTALPILVCSQNTFPYPLGELDSVEQFRKCWHSNFIHKAQQLE